MENDYLGILGLSPSDDLNFSIINKKCTILKVKNKKNKQFCELIDVILEYFQKNDVYSLMDRAQEILPRVYLGSAKLARNLEKLKGVGITHVISIANEFPAYFSEMTNKNAGLPDEKTIYITKEWLDECMSFINTALEQNSNNRVLIHCQYGRTRSAIVATYFIATSLKIDINTAYEKLQAIRDVMIPDDIISNLCTFSQY